MSIKSNLLIVDDEIMVIRSMIRVLGDDQYHIYHTVEPEIALNILRTKPIDVIISDQRMPQITGLELLKMAKEIQSSTVRILVSGYSDINIVIEAVNEGRIYKYISKPWDNDKLLETVEGAIQHKKDEDEKSAILAEKLERIENWNVIANRMNSEIEKTKEHTINALLKVLQVKDCNLFQHSCCVSSTAAFLAEKLGFKQNQVDAIRSAGLLHDIGKIAIRDKIMYKDNALDDEEFNEMKNHPAVGAEILREVDFLDSIADIVQQHHEKLDKGGYPMGLGCDEILPEAQILTVADIFVALREDRVYKKGMTPMQALKILLEGRGIKYNTEAVDALEEAVYSNTGNCINTLYTEHSVKICKMISQKQ